MRKLFIAALMAAGPAFAGSEMVAQQGDDVVRLMGEPCPYASVLRFIPEDKRAEFGKADTRVGGQRFFACWRLAGGQVHLVYEDGDHGAVPLSHFKESPGV